MRHIEVTRARGVWTGIWILCLLWVVSSQAATVQVTWNANTESDLEGYVVYYGTASGSYLGNIYVGNVTQYTINNLTVNQTYYFAVTAYDVNGNESGYSQEVSYRIEDTTAPAVTAVAAEQQDKVKVVFSEPVEKVSSEITDNYKINNGIIVQRAELQGDVCTVYLYTTQHANRNDYVLTVNNVKDRAAVPNTITPNTTNTYSWQGTDQTPPTLVNAELITNVFLKVTFSKALNQSSALTSSNYSISPYAAINSTANDETYKIVYLNTTAHSAGRTYTLTVSNIKDASGNTIAANSTKTYSLAVTDAAAPYPTAVRGIDATHIEVEFNENVDQGSAEIKTNYSISPSVSVQGAALKTDNRTVVLTTSAFTDGQYIVTVTGVKDASNPSNNLSGSYPMTYSYSTPDVMAPQLASAVLTYSNQLDVSFNEIVDPVSAGNSANYAITPSSVSVSKVEVLLDQKKVIVKTTEHADGTYTLKVSNVKDAAGNLINPNYSSKTYSYVSPDKSAPILKSATLRTANLIELIFNEALDRTSSEDERNYSINGVTIQVASLTGDSLNHVNLTTTNHTPGNSYIVTVSGLKDRAAIPNTMTTSLSKQYSYPYQDAIAPKLTSATPSGDIRVDLVFDEALEPASAQNTANYTITATGATAVQVKSAFLDFSQTKVSLATTAHQSGKTYTVTVANVKDMANNVITNLNNKKDYFISTADTKPPELTLADILNDKTVILTFNEPLDPVSAVAIAGKYSINNGITVQSASLSANYQEVRLTTTTHQRGSYIVTVNGLKDQASTPNTMTAAVTKSYSYQPADNTPPVLRETKLVNSQTIQLVFDKALNPSTVVKGNFTITSVGSSSVIAIDQVVLLISGTDVQLNTANHIPGDYKVSIKGIQDAYGGNTILPTVGQYTYAVADNTPPTMREVDASMKNLIVVKFSETMDTVTAKKSSNYVINNGVQVKRAIIGQSFSDVMLETSDHVAGEYTLTVNGVCDAAKNLIKAYSQISYKWNPADTSGPVLISAVMESNNFVKLSFNEALEKSSAENSANFSIQPAISISQAILDASLKNVYLYTDYHSAGTYTITVVNVKDLAFTPNTIKSKYNSKQYFYNPPDTSAPKLVSWELTTPQSLWLFFDEPVTRETAENVANYSIDNGIKITSAALYNDLKKVSLETSPHQSGIKYTIQISGLKDRAPNSNAMKSAFSQQYQYIPADDKGPQLQNVKLVDNSDNKLELVFSETLDRQSAENIGNYSIDPGGVEVLNATLDPQIPKKVWLETTMHMPNFQYGIIVRHVKDQSSNVISPNPSSMSYSLLSSNPMAERTPPYVAKVEALTLNQLEIVFNKPVDKTTAENINNYIIQDSIAVKEAVLDKNTVKVKLTTASSMRSGKTYRVTVLNVKDRSTKPNILSVSSAIQFIYSKGVSISNPSRAGYDLRMVSCGSSCFGNRDYTIQQIPDALKQAVQIITLNNDEDKTSTGTEFLQFQLRGTATIYVAYDKQIGRIPAWLSDWKATGEQVVDSRNSVYAVYSKTTMGGRIVLGANQGTSDVNMYLAFVVPHSGALVTGLNKSSYAIAQVGVGETYYIDRTYTVSSIPDTLNGMTLIKTANDDKANRDKDFLQFTLTDSSKVYVAYDSRIVSTPNWLADWNREEGRITDSRGNTFDLLSKVYQAGDVTLGGNWGTDDDNMYAVLLQPVRSFGGRGEITIPGYFTLKQNYPNPFNPRTTIQFKAHKTGHIKISVYNLLGQMVKVLVDGKFSANYQGEAVWDSTDRNGKLVASGVYFYRIEQDQFAKTMRMTLVK